MPVINIRKFSPEEKTQPYRRYFPAYGLKDLLHFDKLVLNENLQSLAKNPKSIAIAFPANLDQLAASQKTDITVRDVFLTYLARHPKIHRVKEINNYEFLAILPKGKATSEELTAILHNALDTAYAQAHNCLPDYCDVNLSHLENPIPLLFAL
jgi:hypothetical protein